MGIVSKNNNHVKFICDDDVYYITNANIFTDPVFHTITGSVGTKNINLSQFSKGNRFDAQNFINSRGIETRPVDHTRGLYEIERLVAIDLSDFRDKLKQYYQLNKTASGFKYNGLIVRGDLKKCIIKGLLNIF